MVCSADDLVEWRDFPRGLRVLLLDEDGASAVETKSKLEKMDYIVTLFCNDQDAIAAISRKAESFHVAIVEVTTGNSLGSFRFLEMAQDLPTVVISDVHCLSTMMKCIALGAAEFLQKPLSEDKLRNIWQHAVHKAFNAAGSVVSKSLKPIKETVVSMLRLHSETAELKIEIPSEAEDAEKDHEDNENTVGNDRLPAPSTPQLEHGPRLVCDGDCQEKTNCSSEKGSMEDAKDLSEPRKFSTLESKSVDNTCDHSIGVPSIRDVLPSRTEEAAAEEEVNSAVGTKTEEGNAAKEGSLPLSRSHNGKAVESSSEDQKKSVLSSYSSSHGRRGNRKKMKVINDLLQEYEVDWTPELHKRFVQAVEQLGIDQAIPSKILKLMKVEGLTRHNVASHLQKYRLQRRHILPKDNDMRWQPHKDPAQRVYMPKPIVPYPQFHPGCGMTPSQFYPVLSHPGYCPSGSQMWHHAGFPTWHAPPESWSWNTYPGIHADAWGCPVVTTYSQFPMPSPRAPMGNGLDPNGDWFKLLKSSCVIHPAEEEIDMMVKEAVSKPWLPLPLGLKQPSTEAVLAELHRKGISTVPPGSHC